MKKLKPSKEVLLQYLYDYGIKDTCKLLHITEEEFNSILEPSKREHSHHKYNYQISKKKVKRYTKLYPKLVTGVIIDATGKIVLKNSMRQKIIIAYNELKNDPDNADIRMRLKGLLIAARQVNKDAFPTIYKFAFQTEENK